VLIGGPDSDDTVGAWHFELEVGVVGNCHELDIAGAPKNGVVCPMEPNHLESESFLPEVGRSAETDRQVDPPDGLCSLPWHDSVEAPKSLSMVTLRELCLRLYSSLALVGLCLGPYSDR
jgi:hypothetical protein